MTKRNSPYEPVKSLESQHLQGDYFQEDTFPGDDCCWTGTT